MIAQFPEAYPDELFYSVMARYYVRSGHISYRYCSDELFKYFVRPDIEYVSALSDGVKQIVDIPEVIMNHTMFPVNARYISPERRERAYESLLAGTTDYQNCLYRPRGKSNNIRYLRYCPLCAQEDRNQYGETYWHRTHQLQGINVCPAHRCFLCSSAVEISGKSSPNLDPAEIEVPYDAHPLKCVSGTEIAFARYYAKVSFGKLDMETQAAAGEFFHHRIQGTQYTTIRGQNVNTNMLFSDMIEFYSGTSCFVFDEFWKVQKIFSGYNNPAAICELAFFLGISANELLEMQYPAEKHFETYDRKIQELHRAGMNYRKISEAVGGSYDYVKLLGKQDRKESKKKVNGGGKKARDYTALDEQYLPEVEKLIADMFDDSHKPEKVSVGGIEKRLGLRNKTLEHLPKCMALIRENSESWEEFWVREMEWQYKLLSDTGVRITVNNLAKHSLNLSRDDLRRAYAVLDDGQTVQAEIKSILSSVYAFDSEKDNY